MQLAPKWTLTGDYEPVVNGHLPKGFLDMKHHSDTLTQKSTVPFATREASSLLEAKFQMCLVDFYLKNLAVFKYIDRLNCC